MCLAGPASTGPLSAGFVSKLLLRDDLARPGHVVEDQLKAVAVRVAGGVRDIAGLRGFPWPGHGGAFPLGPGVIRWRARSSVPAARPCPAAGLLPGCQGSARRAR